MTQETPPRRIRAMPCERPILMSTPMVRALLDGKKTQTRRVVIPQPTQPHFHHLMNMKTGMPGGLWTDKVSVQESKCACNTYSKYAPGDVMWVREAWCHKITDEGMTYNADGNLDTSCVYYRASNPGVVAVDDQGFHRFDNRGGECSPWKPSIHMPKWAARLWLKVTQIHCHRIQDIGFDDVMAEGVRQVTKDGRLVKYCVYDRGDTSSVPWSEMPTSPFIAFRNLWDSINAKRGYSWESNPWVWAYHFAIENRKSD